MRWMLIFAALLVPPASAQTDETISDRIAPCWNVGSLSRGALKITVVLEFTLSESSELDTTSIRISPPAENMDTNTRQAFEAARRAIIRCAFHGYNGSGKQLVRFGPAGVGIATNRPALVET